MSFSVARRSPSPEQRKADQRALRDLLSESFRSTDGLKDTKARRQRAELRRELALAYGYSESAVLGIASQLQLRAETLLREQRVTSLSPVQLAGLLSIHERKPDERVRLLDAYVRTRGISLPREHLDELLIEYAARVESRSKLPPEASGGPPPVEEPRRRSRVGGTHTSYSFENKRRYHAFIDETLAAHATPGMKAGFVGCLPGLHSPLDELRRYEALGYRLDRMYAVEGGGTKEERAEFTRVVEEAGAHAVPTLLQKAIDRGVLPPLSLALWDWPGSVCDGYIDAMHTVPMADQALVAVNVKGNRENRATQVGFGLMRQVRTRMDTLLGGATGRKPIPDDYQSAGPLSQLSSETPPISQTRDSELAYILGGAIAKSGYPRSPYRSRLERARHAMGVDQGSLFAAVDNVSWYLAMLIAGAMQHAFGPLFQSSREENVAWASVIGGFNVRLVLGNLHVSRVGKFSYASGASAAHPPFHTFVFRTQSVSDWHGDFRASADFLATCLERALPHLKGNSRLSYRLVDAAGRHADPDHVARSELRLELRCGDCSLGSIKLARLRDELQLYSTRSRTLTRSLPTLSETEEGLQETDGQELRRR